MNHCYVCDDDTTGRFEQDMRIIIDILYCVRWNYRNEITTHF